MVKSAIAEYCECPHRTFKREVAVACLVFWCVITARVFWYTSPDMLNAMSTPYSTMSTAVWVFALGAFGLDAMRKQLSGLPEAQAEPEPVEEPRHFRHERLGRATP